MGFPVPGGVGSSSLYPVTSDQVYVASTGNAATDSAAIQAAHDAFDSNGGTITLDPGPYASDGTPNLTKPIHLVGTGPHGPNVAAGASYLTTGSVINCASRTLNALTVNADGFTAEKLALFNTAGLTPTAGAGISVATKGRSLRLVDCSFDGFYVNLDVVNGYEWFVDRCHFFDPVLYGAKIRDVSLPDGGDGIFSNSFVYAGPNNLTPTAGIEWESGGGLKVEGTKINARGAGLFTVGINFAVADGASTGVAVVDGNSIENVVWGVLVQQQSGGANTGVFTRIVISDNEILSTTNAGNCIGVAPAASGKIAKLIIADNMCDGDEDRILLTNVDQVKLSNNRGTLNVQSGVTNLTISSADYAFSTAGRPPAAAMAAGSSYYDTTLHLVGTADGAGNYRKPDATIF